MLLTCCQKHLVRTHVSPMFPSFATRETMFPEAKNVSAMKQKHVLLLETVFPVWQNWETLGKHVPATYVSGKTFPGFARTLTLESNSGLLRFCILLQYYY